MTESRGSASFKRAEQLKRWEDSETNRQPSSPKAPSRITFSLDCVFLAACSAGDKAEVLRLVQSGADVNTSSVDGLTALHQACIDARLDMVEFLIQLGANVNHSDNEGWTPLHATASCGFVSIARYLLDMGARIAAVNNEGELPVDIAEKGPMKDFLQEEIDKAGIDCDKARNEEEQILLEDAKCWCSTQSPDAELGDERTGATPLHIAAAKGYVKVMCLLLGNCLVDVDPVDFDGWTPLHASAHWGQPEAATILVQHGADMDVKNYVGQTCFDVAVSSMINHLKQLKDQSQNPLAAQKKRRPNIPDDLPSKLKKIDVQIESKPKIDTLNNKKTIDWDSSTSSDFSDSESDISSEDNHKDYNMSDEEKKNAVNVNSHSPTSEVRKGGQTTPTILPSPVEPLNEDDPPSWRHNSTRQKSNLHNDTPKIGEKQNNVTTQPQSDGDIILRRTHSCETDKTFYQRYQALTARIKASSLPLIPAPEPANDPALLRSASLKDTPLTTHHYRQEKQKKEVTSPPNPPNVRSSMENMTENNISANNNSSPVMSKLSPGNIFKNFFKSFVPPVRDEESETQRKAHAKRVRETRRSTQGVTLDEIKSAEQLVKKKNGPTKPEAIPPPAEPVRPPTQPPVVPTATEDNEISGKNSSAAVRLPLHRTSNNDISVTIATAPTTVAKATTPVVTATIDAEPIPTGGPERRPSWRLRVDPGCKFALEDDTQQPAETEVNEISETATTVTVPLRRTTPQTNNKEEEKENESRGATQAAQNVIQRRRRPKRRSTGVVDVDDLITDRNNDGESGSESNEQSASEKPSANDEESAEIDYKALWEESQIEIKKLNAIIAEIEKKLEEDRGTIEKYASMAARSSLTETEKREKREKRAMERRLSEMEEELKFQQALQVENQRLKDENGALIRVISKLSK